MSNGNDTDYSDASMLDLFKMEAETHCAAIADNLLALESESNAAGLLESLMRAAHSVKGAARIVQLDIAVQVAHVMEDVFVAAQKGTITLDQDSIDILLKGNDILSRFASLASEELTEWLAGNKAEIDTLIADIKSIEKPVTPPTSTAAPEAAPVADETSIPEPEETIATANQPLADLGDLSMLDLFRMEAETHCATISDLLLQLEENPGATEHLDALMRAAHSVKGAAKVVGLDPAVLVAHAMEDVFVAAQKAKINLDPTGIDLLLRSNDLLSGFASQDNEALPAWLAKNNNTINSVTEALKQLGSGTPLQPPTPAKKKSAPPAPPPTQPVASPESSPLLNLGDLSMLDLFRMEAETHCAAISERLLQLEENPGATEHLEALMRASHSVKGAAKVVGLDAAVHLAHAMEDVFVAAQKNKIHLDHDSTDILLSGNDILSQFASLTNESLPGWLQENNADINLLIKNLQALTKGEKIQPRPDKSPAAPPETPQPSDSSKTKSAPSPVQSQEKEAPAAPQTLSRRKEDKEGLRAVRISADSMNRLLGLAGEVLIESRWLPTFTKELLRLKQRQDDLLRVLDKTREELAMGVRKEKLISLYSDLQRKIELCRTMMAEDLEVVEDHARYATEISHRLYREVIDSRMQPFQDGIRAFPRMVRDISRELGKKVKLVVSGEETKVDRDILEKIEAPLNHMIRNSLDHGIETPEERQSTGKPEEAVIRLEARHNAGMLSITVADDGRGIDVENLRRIIVERKMITEEMAADLSNSELIEFLFLPNFSTKKNVTKISGRGVGLDVVHNVINEVRGRLRSTTKLGQGSSFEMLLPITLSVLRALLTEISGEPYAFPLTAIEHVLRVPVKHIKEVEGRQYFTLNDKRIGLVSAHQVLNTTPHEQDEDDEVLVIVLSDRLNQYGLIVDQFWGVRDLVVQPLDPRLGKVKDISSAALLEDGTPVLVIDVDDLVRSMDILISGNRLMRINDLMEISAEKHVKRILVADDSITVREVERKMLLAKGYDIDVAIDGMDAWNNIRNNEYNLVVTDVDMPRMDGIELVTLIKNDPRLRHLPVIIVSYKDREEDRNRGLEAGADYYLTKGSFQDETLVNAVKDLIGEPIG